MSTQATKTIVVTEATHEAVGHLRELLEATRGTPYSHGDAVAHAVRSTIHNPHRFVATIMSVAGQLVPALSGHRFDGVSIDGETEPQTITIRFHDREPVEIVCVLPE